MCFDLRSLLHNIFLIHTKLNFQGTTYQRLWKFSFVRYQKNILHGSQISHVCSLKRFPHKFTNDIDWHWIWSVSVYGIQTWSKTLHICKTNKICHWISGLKDAFIVLDYLPKLSKTFIWEAKNWSCNLKLPNFKVVVVAFTSGVLNKRTLQSSRCNLLHYIPPPPNTVC